MRLLVENFGDVRVFKDRSLFGVPRYVIEYFDPDFGFRHTQIYSAIWYKKERFTPPSPSFVKQSVLLRHAVDNATWIETGTYLGSTTSILSERFPIVHTIEPSKECLQIARQNLKAFKNIIFHNGCSEDCL